MIKTAMILAAGRGERMRPLTDTIPKPLLKVHGQCLIDYHILALAKIGVKQIIINIAYKGAMIKEHLGQGDRFGLNIHYSDEGDYALEAAGGIIGALPLLGQRPFLLVNADIWTNHSFQSITLPQNKLATLVLVNNPAQHANGDFSLDNTGLLHKQGSPMLTYSGIGLYHPDLFKNLEPGKRPLRPLLLEAIDKQLISGQHYRGLWHDIGTAERLAAISS